MKRTINYITLFIAASFYWSCEDIIEVELPMADPVIVIDGWINNKPEAQKISVMKTVQYFENTSLPGLNNAIVQVEDLTDHIVYDFQKSNDDGIYIWEPSQARPVFGEIGNDYKLTVQDGNSVYESYSSMNRVPTIDSVLFSLENGNNFLPDIYYLAQFYAVDLIGTGDTYWIKTWKNGHYLNKPSEINISYDAGGSPGAIIDGITFGMPTRIGINPLDKDENDEFLAPYEPGDSVYVELHSINNETYNFLNEVAIQTNRSGGFAELFAQPLANVSTNILIADESPEAVRSIGFFNISAVSAMGLRLDPDNLPE